VSSKKRTAITANVCRVIIGRIHETIMKEERNTVSKERVTLHFTETDTTMNLTTLDRLASDRVDRTSSTSLELILDHVTQTLVEHDTNEDISHKRLTGDTGVKRLRTEVVVTSSAELLTKVIHSAVVLIELERSTVLELGVESTRLTSHGLDKHTDGHTRRESVRVNDNIGAHTRLSPRHIHLREENGENTLLTVTGRELITIHGVTVHTELKGNLL